MGKQKRKKPDNNGSPTKESSQTYYMIPKSTLWVIGSIGSIAVTIMAWLAVQVYNFNGDMKGVPGKVEAIETAMNGDGTQGNPGMNAKLIAVENGNKSAINASEETIASMAGLSVEPNGGSRTTVSLDAATVLGTDAKGQECNTKDYVGQQILLTYIENEKEVVFLGQFNDKYHWDGYCVVNTYYPSGRLYGICESNFQDGIRLDFISFVYDEGSDDWIYSNRICEESYNSGKNKTYKYDATEEKYFTQTNARASDIFFVNDYVRTHDMTLMTEYVGRTVDGVYNDTTGEAYYISYYEDQTVKTLYQGGFTDGKMEDKSGNAWQIASDRDNRVKYLYYCGVFERGTTKNTGGQGKIETALTAGDIQKILKEKDCVLELQWDKQSITSK